MGKRKVELSIWLIRVEIRNNSTGAVERATYVTAYAHTTETAAMNELKRHLNETLHQTQTYRILESFGVKWSWIKSAFEDFIDFGDDDDSGTNQDDPPVNPDPEDHGVPVLFEELINSLEFERGPSR